MLTKPQFFYDHTTKQALGFKNPFYLKKAQQLEPKLYVDDIIEKTNPIVIPDSEETLLLAEESHSKILLKQKDPYMLERKFTTPADYAFFPFSFLKSFHSPLCCLNHLLKNFCRMELFHKQELSNEQAHSAYIKHTQEEATVLRDLVEHVKSKYPLNQSLESTCRYVKQVHELLTNISKNCPSINNADGKLVAVTPKNKDKSVRFTKPVTSLGNTITKTTSTSNLVSNKPMLSSTGVKPSTSASGSQPSGNTKKDKIRQTPSSTQKNKVEAHPRKVKYSLKNKDCVVQPKGTAHVQHSKLNANSEPKCRPTGRTFIIVGNACPLTRITTTTEVHLRKPTALENETPKPVVTLVYSRKPMKSNTNVPISKSMVLKSVSANKKEPSPSRGSIVSDVPSSSFAKCRLSSSPILSYDWRSKHMTGDRSQLTNFVNKFFGTVKFRNDHMAKILGYGDYQIRNVTISRVYYVEGLGHKLFSVGSKDEALDFIIKFLKMIQVRLKVLVRRIRTDNGTEFVNQTLREYYEKVGISHETSVARSPQQNGVVERRNRTLIEVARTMLIYAKALLFLWAEAVATACYTQNRSIVRLRQGKTPYELLHDKPPDLSFFHVFGALCYPKNDSDNLGKL
ncbi:retrovirus-related pol polyprotein from transposon TNT 1-94 [Tanacetum coccineum]